MSKNIKKTFISSLLQPNLPEFAAVYFRVGCVPIKSDGSECINPDGTPAFPRVTDIKHCRDRFGSGAQINQPCYVVSFEGSSEQTIIPTSSFTQATVVVEVADTEESIIPNLPE